MYSEFMHFCIFWTEAKHTLGVSSNVFNSCFGCRLVHSFAELQICGIKQCMGCLRFSVMCCTLCIHFLLIPDSGMFRSFLWILSNSAWQLASVLRDWTIWTVGQWSWFKWKTYVHTCLQTEEQVPRIIDKWANDIGHAILPAMLHEYIQFWTLASSVQLVPGTQDQVTGVSRPMEPTQQDQLTGRSAKVQQRYLIVTISENLGHLPNACSSPGWRFKEVSSWLTSF